LRLSGVSDLKGDSLSASSTSKNPSKIRTFGSQDFFGTDFRQIKAQNAVNPVGFTSILTMSWRKSAPKKRVRITLVTLVKEEKV